jgi:release factor glutamine methyltransferase
MNLYNWLKEAGTKLKLAGIASWHQDAQIIAMHHLNINSAQAILGDSIISDTNLMRLNLAIERRTRMEPIAYILGKVDFYGREFIIDDRVLIPRPETENLIDLVLNLNLQEPSLLDLGTGSGVIGLTLALEITKSKVDMLDISLDSIDVAKMNYRKFKDQIEFSKSIVNFGQSDLLTNYHRNSLDLIVANLPYVDIDWGWLDLKSLSFEPGIALWAEDSGLSLIKKLLATSQANLKNGGYLVLELDSSQKRKVVKLGVKLGWKHLEIDKSFGDFVVAFAKS